MRPGTAQPGPRTSGARCCNACAWRRARAVAAALLLSAACVLAGPRAAGAVEPLQPLAPAPGTVQVEATPDSTVLQRARARFDRARFAAVVALLRPALDADSVAVADRTAALELLGRSLVRTGDVEGGVGAFTRLLDAAPAWTLEPRRVGDDERAVFQRARLEWRSAHPDYVRAEAEAAARPILRQPWYRQGRFQAAGGAAILGVTVAVIRHQGQVNHAHAALPDLPGHP
jgi:hypothetical protein